jgi:hypothetical protein
MDTAPARLREQIDLDDALAERRQAIGAQQQHLASTQTFTDESVATFISIRDTTTDEHLRAIAQTYVDCATPKRCTIDTSNDRREIDDAILKI